MLRGQLEAYKDSSFQLPWVAKKVRLTYSLKNVECSMRNMNCR